MAEELEWLGDAGPDLLGSLTGTDTHVGITSNDAIVGGRLRGPNGGEPWLDLSTVTDSQAFNWFEGATSVLAEGTHLARGLDMVVEAIDSVGDTWNAGFRRDEAALVVIFVADRDDESVMDDAQWLVWLDEETRPSGEAGKVHAVVPNGEIQCAGTTGEAVIYTGLAATTYGDTVSICAPAPDYYGPELAAIGAAEVPAYDVVLALSVTPIPATISVELLRDNGATETLDAEEVIYEPFANTVSLPEWAWSEIATVTVRYLVLPEELTGTSP
jgi:hypothetical protein